MECWALDVDWPAIADVVGAIAQGAGALVVAYVAVKGLDAWRDQLHGTKRQALAEECLCNTYQLEYLIGQLRHPMAWAAEMKAVPALDGESEEERHERAPFGVIEVRFAPHADAYAAMLTSRFRLQTVFGKDVREKFDSLLGVVTEVRNAALQVLSARKQAEQARRLAERNASWEQRGQMATEHLARLEAIIWGTGGEHDTISAKVSGLVADLEARLKNDAAGR